MWDYKTAINKVDAMKKQKKLKKINEFKKKITGLTRD